MADKLGRRLPNLVRDNVFINCSNPLIERKAGVWKACFREGNLVSEAGSVNLVPLKSAQTVLQ